MTQQKRAKPHKVCVFGADQALPVQIPDDTMVYLMNRHFKLKVIQLACERVPPLVCRTLLGADPQRRFIVDYKCAVEYTHDTPNTPTPLPDLVPLGESDVKFVRYVERYGNALVHAVDGDYLAIALLYYTACGLRDDNRIFLYRQLSRLNPPAAAGNSSSSNTDARKRKQPASASAATPPPTSPSKCWVDMQLLFAVIARSVWQAHPTGGRAETRPVNPRTRQAFGDADAVYSAVCLMLCAGTDFSRAMPLLGPKRLWEALPLVVDSMLRAASGSLVSGDAEAAVGDAAHHNTAAPLDVDLFGADVLAPIYASVFARHVGAAAFSSAQPLAHVMHKLRSAPGLAASTTRRLPTPAQVRVTLLNVGWVIKYWLAYNSRVPSPLDGSHGFARCPLTSTITFTDLIAAAASGGGGGGENASSSY
jgi:hypothetical protein